MIDIRATAVLETVENDVALESDTRQAAKRHLRELRAELECAHRQLCDSADWRDSREEPVTVIRNPTEAARRRVCERAALADARARDDTRRTGRSHEPHESENERPHEQDRG
ncbi:hypothetical protein [Natronococcus wangiae]|uniref:hypothetical protein n=1 Tax=Natronococcus wangiae TaxID=3068275 RepID=UPI00273D1AF0|nr:hypothetical protein [Natronococcus sp. AD5]